MPTQSLKVLFLRDLGLPRLSLRHYEPNVLFSFNDSNTACASQAQGCYLTLLPGSHWLMLSCQATRCSRLLPCPPLGCCVSSLKATSLQAAATLYAASLMHTVHNVQHTSMKYTRKCIEDAITCMKYAQKMHAYAKHIYEAYMY
jgi:hypothetical protein